MELGKLGKAGYGLTFDKLVRERKVSADINPDDILFDDLEI